MKFTLLVWTIAAMCKCPTTDSHMITIPMQSEAVCEAALTKMVKTEDNLEGVCLETTLNGFTR